MSLLAGLGEIVGGLFGKSSANKAAKAQEKSAAAAIAENRRQFDLSRSDMLAAQTQARGDAMPWMTAGQNALSNLQNPAAFTASPDYQFRRSEGERGIGNSFAARGGAFSGNALKALSEFNQNLASSEYGNWWNRQAGVAGVGQATSAQQGSNAINGANALANLGANSSQYIGNALMSAGDARASGIVGGANALTQGLSGAINAWQYGNGTGGGNNGGIYAGTPWGSRYPWQTPPIWQGRNG